MTSRPTSVPLGPYDPFKRVPSVSFQDGKVTFTPGQGSTEFAKVQTEFPTGARLEYRQEKGDLYFTGDRSLHLSSSLWVIRPDGSRESLAQGYSLYIHRRTAARNLERAGVSFKVVSIYKEPNGHVVENDIKISRSPLVSASVLLLGTSSLWLGALTAFLTHELRNIILAGVVGLSVLAFASMRGGSSKRSGLIKVLAIIPSYAAGYAVSVVIVWHLFR